MDALDVLPNLPLDGLPLDERQQSKATGTESASQFAPNSDSPRKLGAVPEELKARGNWPSAKNDPKKLSVSQGFAKHARQDSNLQPLVPKVTEVIQI
jgi:hypothetical protein